jgi:hypothetical protein
LEWGAGDADGLLMALLMTAFDPILFDGHFLFEGLSEDLRAGPTALAEALGEYLS